MTTYARQEISQAKYYAYQSLQIHMYRKYKRIFKQLFDDNVVFETRKADREKDKVFIPPGLDYKVVTRSGFTKRGCEMISCFRYKEDLKPCEPDDELRWVRIGLGFSLACQKACKHGMVDVEFYGGRCMLSNHHKKLLAMFPEELFGMKNRHNFHGGLDVIDGHLRLNEEYCRSYGLDYDDGDCYASGVQAFGEGLFGSTIIRSMTYRSIDRSELPPFPDLPTELDFTSDGPTDEAEDPVDESEDELEDPVEIPPVNKTIGEVISSFPTLPIDLITNRRRKREIAKEEDDESGDTRVVLELAKDLSIDFGVELGLRELHKFLKKRAPRLMVQLGKSVVLRSAMGTLIARSYFSMAATVSKTAGMGVSAASGVLTSAAVASIFLDIFDPFEFNRVLDKRTLKNVDAAYDRQYFFERDQFDNEMTLDEFYNIVEVDVTEQALFLEEKMREYLESIHGLNPFLMTKSLFAFSKLKSSSSWKDRILLIMVVSLLFICTFAMQCMIYFFTLILLLFMGEYAMKNH